MTRRQPFSEEMADGSRQMRLFDEETETEAGPVTAGPAPADTATVPTTVVCLKGRRDDPDIADVVYVGRPLHIGGWHLDGHPLANPYRAGRDGTPAQVVAEYERWLDAHPALVARELSPLRGRRLGCWCEDGAPCHARVLARRADRTPTDTPATSRTEPTP